MLTVSGERRDRVACLYFCTSISHRLSSYESNLGQIFAVKCQHTDYLSWNDAGPAPRSRGLFSKKFRRHAFKARKG